MRVHSSHCSQMGPIHPAIFDPATLIWPSWSDIFFHQTSLKYKPISCYNQIFVAEGHMLIVNRHDCDHDYDSDDNDAEDY